MVMFTSAVRLVGRNDLEVQAKFWTVSLAIPPQKMISNSGQSIHVPMFGNGKMQMLGSNIVKKTVKFYAFTVQLVHSAQIGPNKTIVLLKN